LDAALDPEKADGKESAEKAYQTIEGVLTSPKGSAVPLKQRLESYKTEPRIAAFLKQTDELAKSNDKLGAVIINKPNEYRPAAESLRPELLVYLGNGHLPARNVANLGTVLYSEHLLAVEMAGTLLLVATVGAVAIAGRRREAKEVPA